MKFTSLALAVFGVCAIVAQAATAQVVRPVPMPDFRVAMDDTAPSPSDLVIPEPPVVEDQGGNMEKQYDCGEDGHCGKSDEKQAGGLFDGKNGALQTGPDCGCGGLKGCAKCGEVEAWELMPRTCRGHVHMAVHDYDRLREQRAVRSEVDAWRALRAGAIRHNSGDDE